jgi:hypothetical protein
VSVGLNQALKGRPGRIAVEFRTRVNGFGRRFDFNLEPRGASKKRARRSNEDRSSEIRTAPSFVAKQNAGLQEDVTYEILTHEERVTIDRFAMPDRRLRFAPDRLTLETLDGIERPRCPECQAPMMLARIEHGPAVSDSSTSERNIF